MITHSHSSNPIHTNMRDRMERFVLLPFEVGCISEASIPVGSNPNPRNRGRIHEGVKVNHYFNNRSKDESFNTALQRLLNNFKNLSQLFVYKDELEPEMEIEIGVPTDVKHVTHIGLDDCVNSIFSKSWNNVAKPDLINLHQKEVEFAMATQGETPGLRSLLQTKYH